MLYIFTIHSANGFKSDMKFRRLGSQEIESLLGNWFTFNVEVLNSRLFEERAHLKKHRCQHLVLIDTLSWFCLSKARHGSTRRREKKKNLSSLRNRFICGFYLIFWFSKIHLTGLYVSAGKAEAFKNLQCLISWHITDSFTINFIPKSLTHFKNLRRASMSLHFGFQFFTLADNMEKKRL